MNPEIPYKYISVEGNIGTGKTTLCELLARDYNCQVVLEEFAENPFLKYFYENPARYAFTVELFFMTERHKQLQHNLLKPSLFHEFTVSDYLFWKSIIFARKTLEGDEYRLLQNLFHILNNNFPNPDILIYLHRSPAKLLELIKKRGRPFEQSIRLEYLQQIQDSYFEYFRNELSYPILIVDVEHLDFASEPAHYSEIREILSRKYLPGVHRIALHL